MAQHFAAGTIETNFNPEQQNLFQQEAYVHQAVETGEHPSEEEARKALHEGEWSPEIFDQDGPNFYNTTDFDAEAARFAIQAVFTQFPNQTPPLTATMGVAFWCSKPRMGEFWGLREEFTQ